jgi:hypothetical protein
LVYQVSQGETLYISGRIEQAFIVIVNADPLGEVLDMDDLFIWQNSQNGCRKIDDGVSDFCWTIFDPKNIEYPALSLSGLQTPVLGITGGDESYLSVWLKYDMESAMQGQEDECVMRGYDGFQLRAVVIDGQSVTLTPTTVERSEGQISPVDYVESPGFIEAFRQRAAVVDGWEDLATVNTDCETTTALEGSCVEDFRGFAGSSEGWVRVNFSIPSFVSGSVYFEFLFGSDDASGGEGIWIDDVIIVSNGNQVYFDDCSPQSTHMIEKVKKKG